MQNVLNEIEKIGDSYFKFWSIWFGSYFTAMHRYLSKF